MQTKNIYGLVVCGGESKRMGTDKSLINYHGIPQRYYLYELLQPLCDRVFISCNPSQVVDMHSGYQLIIDSPHYLNIGPMAALLSAFEKYPDQSFLIIGCDYPLIGKDDIQKLVSERDNDTMAVCYQNNQSIAEPLLALYETQTFSFLKNYYLLNNYSLRYFLDTVKAKRIVVSNDDVLKSVDTEEQTIAVLNQIKSGNKERANK